METDSVRDSSAANELAAYRRAIAQTLATGQATEHSYRPDLQGLLQALGGPDIRAINEPSHVACGAPDFIVERRGTPIGHVECKNPGANLDAIETDDQLKRYRNGLPNLILTDYLEFRWYVRGELRQSARLGRPDTIGGISYDRNGSIKVRQLLREFFNATVPVVSDSRDLAARMAAKARLLRDGIGRILKEESGTGPLHGMLKAFRDVLISGLSEDDFADLQAQTSAYGLFAARCLYNGAQPFTRQVAVFADSTPFLRDVFGRIAGPSIDPRIAWIVDDLALLLDRADMASILHDFGRTARREDPVVHFYEDFLAAYDPQLRKVRGVYYTPEPVVSYIVNSIDWLLRDRFGLADGLAQTVSADGGRPVLILDPAAGTGTFLREAVIRIRETIENKRLEGAWPDYIRNHLLPRLFGFELLMAPYAICHLKLALEIGGADAGFRMPEGQRLGVFLTNALEEPHEATAGALFAHEIAQEASSADSVKRDQPVMIVLGNPPYSGHTANKGVWITDLLRGNDGGVETGNYFCVDGQPLRERNSKWLNDDYVKFIRFAQWRIEKTGEGVIGFITNHAWLDNPTFRGMRQSLMETFDEIYLLDLHGNAKKGEIAPDGSVDANVFDIQQGVAINLLVKHASGEDQLSARVFHADLWGEREDDIGGGKYGWLAANDAGSTNWAELSPKPPLYVFAPRDEALIEEYEAGCKITSIFPVNSVGVATARDNIAIQWTGTDMRRVAADFSRSEVEEARRVWRLGTDTQSWKVISAQQDIGDHPDPDRHVVGISYRPFDRRFTWYTGRSGGFICRPRPQVMRHMLVGSNLGLCVGRAGQVTGPNDWDIVFVSESPSDLNLFRRGGNCLCPLYRYPQEENIGFERHRTSNLDPGFINHLRSAVDLDWIADGAGDLLSTFGPEDVFHYIYAILHSPEYRRRYADLLKSDFPRIPSTSSRSLFAVLAGLGQMLVSLHLMQADGAGPPSFPRTGSNRVDRVRYAPPGPDGPGRVWINADQYFKGVEPDTWAFTIGGYRPAEKWLKDRRGRSLSFDDIVHYGRICGALDETRRIMADIDTVIQNHGGWPLAQSR